jgi:hypothetical protein
MDYRIIREIMKNQTSHTIKNLFVIVLLLLTGYVQANDAPPGFDDDVPDNPAAPIDSWIIPMVVLALLIMYYYNKNTKRSGI